MPIVDLDFGNLTPRDGEYDVVCTAVTDRVKKETGDKYLIFRFEIVGPEFEGVGIDEFRTLLPQGRKFLQEFLQGLTGKDFNQDGMSIDTEDLVGCSARAVVNLQEYEGIQRPRIKRLYQASPDQPYPQFNKDDLTGFFDSAE